MSATDELCRLLNELRNLARDINEAEIRSHSVITMKQGQYSRWFKLYMNRDWLNAWHTEHERVLQAIAATMGRESYGKDDKLGKGAEPGERESYDQLKAKYDELCELTRDMWTFTELVDVSARLSSGGAWSAAEFGKRMKELGVIE